MVTSVLFIEGFIMNMNVSVVTIPLSPSHATHLGFYSLFAYVHRLAADENCLAVYGINMRGKEDAPEQLLLLERNLELLNVAPGMWWNDSALQPSDVQDAFDHLQTLGIIEVQQCDIARCSCGKVEYLAHVQLQGGRKALAHDGVARCCNTDIVTAQKRVLLTVPLPVMTMPGIFPDWARKEAVESLKKISGNRFLMSRSTQRNFSVSMNGEDFWIDNDMLWWLYSFWLNQSRVQVDHFVAGASTISHVCKMLLFNSLLGIRAPKTVHVLPKISFEPVHGIQSIEQTVRSFGNMQVTNALLWSALSQRKDITLRGMLFPQMSNSKPSQHLSLSRKFLLKNRE